METADCNFCGENFSRPINKGARRIYCSPSCKSEANRIACTASRYGLGIKVYKRLIDNAPVCECCRQDFDAKGPVVDHNHATGRVRGIICQGCNIAAGHIEKRGDLVSAYLKRAEREARQSSSRVRSIRANESDWQRWEAASLREGISLNAWATRSLNRVAELEESLARQAEEAGRT